MQSAARPPPRGRSPTPSEGTAGAAPRSAARGRRRAAGRARGRRRRVGPPRSRTPPSAKPLEVVEGSETSAAAQTVLANTGPTRARLSRASEGVARRKFRLLRRPRPGRRMAATPPKASPTSARADLLVLFASIAELGRANASVFYAFATSDSARLERGGRLGHGGDVGGEWRCPTRCRRRGAASAGRRGGATPQSSMARR